MFILLKKPIISATQYAVFLFEKCGTIPSSFKSLIVLCMVITSNSAFSTSFSGGAGGVYASDLPSDFVSIRVVGPNDFFVDSKDAQIQAVEGSLADGQYNFEVFATDNNAVLVPSTLNNGRSANVPTQQPVKAVDSGSFRIVDGQIVAVQVEERE
jgi:hypothetical protein